MFIVQFGLSKFSSYWVNFMNHASFVIRGTFVLVLLFLVSNTNNVVNGQVIWDRDHLDRVRAGEYSSEEKVILALKNLRVAADAALQNEPYSVTHKTIEPPSGDKHDYLSFSRYWWPDPKKPDGLPYIRKDGGVIFKTTYRILVWLAIFLKILATRLTPPRWFGHGSSTKPRG